MSKSFSFKTLKWINSKSKPFPKNKYEVFDKNGEKNKKSTL